MLEAVRWKTKDNSQNKIRVTKLKLLYNLNIQKTTHTKCSLFSNFDFLYDVKVSYNKLFKTSTEDGQGYE